MSIDVSGLQDWPDQVSLDTTATELAAHGVSFAQHMLDAYSCRQGLSGCYETPFKETMYTAFDSATAFGSHVENGCFAVSVAIEQFATALSGLKERRKELLAEVEAFSAAEDPYVGLDPAASFAREKEHGRIHDAVQALVAEYHAAIDECVGALRGIGDDGLPTPDSAVWERYLTDAAISGAGTVVDNQRMNITRVTTRIVVRFAGKDVKLPINTVYRKSPWRFESWFVAHPRGSTFTSRMGTAVRETVLGPEPGRYSEKILREAVIKGRYGSGWERAGAVKTAVPGKARFAGRALYAVGIGMTYRYEADGVDRRLREEEPHLTAAERAGRVAEPATVRTIAQVTGSAVGAAAVGAVIPVGGAAVGFFSGLVVGGVLTFVEMPDGTTLGDEVADLGEDVWNRLKDVLGWG